MTVLVRLLRARLPSRVLGQGLGQAVSGGDRAAAACGYAPAGCPGTTRGGAHDPENASADAPERRALEPLRGRDAGAGRAQMVDAQQAARERRRLAEPAA